MSEGVLIATIGIAGTVDGALGTAVLSRRTPSANAVPAVAPPVATQSEQTDPLPALGEKIDARELRILRALFGEPKERILEAYQGRFYKPALAATLKQGRVRLDDAKHRLTPAGADVCRTYL